MANLNAAIVRNATAPGKYHDGAGLMLIVNKGGSRNWIQRLTVHGKRRDIGLGAYPAVTLAAARAKAAENKQIARNGGNPVVHRDRGGEPTFEAAALAVHRLQAPGWRNPKHAAQWISTLRQYAYPALANRPVSTITTADVMAVLMPIWWERPETARRVRQRIGTVMRWTVAQGHRPDNPAGDVLSAVLPRQRNGAGARQHHRALPYDAVAGALARVRASKRASLATKLAFEFIVLTAARSGEVRAATWSEIDMDAATWTVPAERMKAGREHRVPLSRAALDVLHQAAGIEERAAPSRRTGLVFPSVTGKTLSDSTISKLIRELGIEAVPHGFRSSFRDWAAECTATPHAVMEAALAHTIANRTEAAYARSDLFDKRRALMDAWADYLGG